MMHTTEDRRAIPWIPTGRVASRNFALRAGPDGNAIVDRAFVTGEDS